jgi:hypothetical protein
VLFGVGDEGDEHVFAQFLAGEEGGHVFEGGGDHFAAGEAAGGELGGEGLGEVEDDFAALGAVAVEGVADGGFEVGVAFAAAEGEAEGVGDFGEVGEAEAGVGAAADDVVGEEAGLGLADGVVAAVVEDEDFDGEARPRMV